MIVRELEVQRVIETGYIPGDAELQMWFEKALADYSKDAEVLIRVVGKQEISALNEQYRHKQGPTNILSFPFEAPEVNAEISLLGDLVVCAPILEKEAQTQQKTLKDHWVHIVIHGILHLIGYDHINENEAIEMEAKEIYILQQLDIDNPYQEKDVNG